MKNDGHIKLTVEAIKQMQRNCNVEKKLCTLPIFNADNTQWHDSSKSNQMDFISAYIGYLLNLKAYNFNALDPRRDLARRVAAVDFDESWTHNDPLGQRYHFMKASSESEKGLSGVGWETYKAKWLLQKNLPKTINKKCA